MNALETVWRDNREETVRRADVLSSLGNVVCPKCLTVYKGSMTNRPPCPFCKVKEGGESE